MTTPPARPPARTTTHASLPMQTVTDKQTTTAKKFGTSSGVVEAGAQRIVVYGEGGIGKSTLVSLIPRVKFIDLESGTANIEADRVTGVDTWADMLEALAEPSVWKGVNAVAIDSVTKAQELCLAHVLATVKNEKGVRVFSIEDYGYGKGYRYLYEAFQPLLVALDKHAAAGRHVVLISHDTTERVPNPDGDDFLQYQPAIMQNGKTCLLRDRVKQWCDHLLFLRYDRSVKDGKVKGEGSRAVWPQADATYWAKSRSLRKPVVFAEGDDSLWRQLIPGAFA